MGGWEAGAWTDGQMGFVPTLLIGKTTTRYLSLQPKQTLLPPQPPRPPNKTTEPCPSRLRQLPSPHPHPTHLNSLVICSWVSASVPIASISVKGKNRFSRSVAL